MLAEIHKKVKQNSSVDSRIKQVLRRRNLFKDEIVPIKKILVAFFIYL